MGGRGAFLDVEHRNFHFKLGGKLYHAIGMLGNVKVLLQDKGAVKAPEFSHSTNSVYAIIQKGRLKQIAFYDEDHNQNSVIDFGHSHFGIQPHKHYYLNHDDKGIPVTKEELALAEKIRKEFKVL